MKKNTIALLFLIIGYISVNSQQIEKQNFNPIIPDYIADPSVVMFNGVFYMYATTDINQGLKRMGIPVVWKSNDFVNWSFEGTIIPDIDWGKEYSFVNKKGDNETGYFKYWAPGKPIEQDGKYYLFPTIVYPDSYLGTYTMVADKPEGPFIFTNGTGVYFNDTINNQNETTFLIDDIDGEPFVDDDGKKYIYWRRRKASALSDDMTQLTGKSIVVPTTYGGYSEGPVMFKRKDIYYYIYTLSGHANYCNGYMISKEGPLGPFNKPDGKGIFIHSNIKNNVWGTGHGNVFQLPGTDQFYFLYLEYGEGGTTRQVYVNKMEFNEDGTIKSIVPDKHGVGAIVETSPKINLALGAIVTASSSEEEKQVETKIIPDPNALETLNVRSRDGDSVSRTFTYVPENAIDGSNGTQWKAVADDKEPWFMVDLGKMKKVSSCEIAFIFPTFGHAFKLEKSVDGEKWITCKEIDEPEVLSPHVVNKIGKARYLKVTISNGYKGIWELMIYE